jgi:hypothetical protein
VPHQPFGAFELASSASLSKPGDLTKLTQLGAGLRASIARGGNALPWCNAILEWGLGPRTRAALAVLRAQGAALEAYLGNMQAWCNLAIVNTDHLVPPLIHMNSGLAKIHSLASHDGLMIFDSRVAFALGKLINAYCNDNNIHPIPPSLRLFRTAKRTPPPVLAVDENPDDNHSLFPSAKFNPEMPGTNVGWLSAQIRVSWLIEAVLTGDPTLFPGLAAGQRGHQLEAALFMMGA